MSRRGVAGTQGFEPRYADPESAVLPLDDVPVRQLQSTKPRGAWSTPVRVVHYGITMRMWLRAGVLAGCVALTAAAVDWKAQRREGYVTDFAGVIDPESRARIEAYCAALEQATGANLSLVVVDSLEHEPAADVARAFYDGWKLGDRGLLVMLSRHARRHEIYAGSRLGAPPGLAADMLREMRPALRSLNYPEALMAAAETAGNQIARARGVKLNASLPRQMHPSMLDNAWWIVTALFLAVV